MNETAHRTKRGVSMRQITNSGLNSKGAAFQLPDSRPELKSAMQDPGSLSIHPWVTTTSSFPAHFSAGYYLDTIKSLLGAA